MSEYSYLRSYQKDSYEKLSLTVDILLFTIDEQFNLQLLLVKRANYPYKNHWALPGSFVGIEESVEEAAIRTMVQKVGMSNVHIEQLYTFGSTHRDPRMRIVTVAYLALVPRAAISNIEKNAELFRVSENDGVLRFLSKTSIWEDELAFDHKDIVKLAIQRMRGKINYTDIALRLVKDSQQFTIFELQKIYEAIENRTHDTANFRRYVKNRYETTGIIEKTGELCREFSKRPSSYYRVNREEG